MTLIDFTKYERFRLYLVFFSRLIFGRLHFDIFFFLTWANFLACRSAILGMS